MNALEFLYEYLWVPVAVVFVGYLLLRWMGQRAVTQMTAIDLLILMILSTAVTEPIVTKKLGVALYYSLAVAALYILLAKAQLKNSWKQFLIPKPIVLVQHGDINEVGLRKAKMPLETLLAEMRGKGYTAASDLELAVMEEVGKISFIPKADYRPLQPSDLQITPAPTFIPIPVIIDGKIIYENLVYLKKGQPWLRSQLKANGRTMEEIEDITLATYTQQGTLSLDYNHSFKGSSPNDYQPGNNS